MYIRVAQFFDTFVLVVKKQHNTRTVWSGIFFSLTFTVVVIYCIHSLKRKKFMTDTKIIHIPMHEILALVEHTITQLSEDDAIEFVMDLQEKISEMLPV